MIEIFRVVFIGICSFVQMADNPPAKRMIMPNLSRGDAQISRHVAFVMFPAAAYDGNDGWGEPRHATFEGQEHFYFLIDGDDLSLSQEAEPLTILPGYEQYVPHLRAYCPGFLHISDDYLSRPDGSKKVGQMEITGGTLRARTMFSGMIGSELTVKTNGDLVIKARSWATGAVRSVSVKPGAEVWIGNMSEAFFDPNASHDREEVHFLAYYRMSADEAAAACSDYPGRGISGGRAHAAPASAAGHEVGKDFNVTCSNSSYP